MGGGVRRFLAALATAVALAAAPPVLAKPQRVVSLNLCTDQLAVLLLPRERIAALSFLAQDRELSAVADRAAGLPAVHGMAEEILPLQPDLVLAGSFTTRPTVALLKARGIRVLELGLADDFDAIRAQLRQVADALGEQERAEALLAAMDATLARAAPADGQRPSALSLAPGGFTAGSGTLSDQVMRAAGLRNYAAARGLAGYGYLPVEMVAADPPDLLLDKPEGGGTSPSLANRLLTHPALARSVPPDRRPVVPGALITCGTPLTADAVTLLAEARAALLAAPPQVAERSAQP